MSISLVRISQGFPVHYGSAPEEYLSITFSFLLLICHFSGNLDDFYKKKGPVSRSFPYLSVFQEYINLLPFSFTAFQIELPAFLIPFQVAEPTTLAAEATFFALL